MSSFPRRLCLWLTCAAELWTFASGQTTHTVLMGVSGSFFDPAVLSVELNDTVTFVFGSGFHGVTQSSFKDPCLPLPGGFSSGFVSALNYSQPIESWNLIVTNVSAPIWYFCPATRPQSHCGAGMVGAINPPSIAMFNDFVSAAKAVNGTPTPSVTVALTGVGAFATGSPSATPGAPTPSPPPSPPPSTTPIPSTSAPAAVKASSSSSSSKAGTIAGGVIGGFIAIFIIAVLLYLLHRTRRRLHQKEYIDNSSVFKETNNSTIDIVPDGFRNGEQNQSPVPVIQQSPSGRRYMTLRPLPIPPGHVVSESTSQVQPQMTQMDMHALAREVATLIRSPPMDDVSIVPSSVGTLTEGSPPGKAVPR